MFHSRRQFLQFLQSSAAVAVGFSGLQRLVEAGSPDSPCREAGLSDEIEAGMGPLLPDPKGLLDLPAGFSYNIVSRTGDKMDDGFFVPAAPDGMATFPGPDGLTIIVRNHEVDPRQPGPFGANAQLLGQVDRSQLYDLGEESKPCNGGTTTLVYDTKNQKLVKQYLSLAGTIRNCAGGPTPWGTWITCEEATDHRGLNQIDGDEIFCQRNHGYNFEVPASTEAQLTKAEPLTAMGRFRHEAVAVDPNSGIVFQTEDVDDSLIYRFIPNQPGKLSAGGKLQALAFVQQPSADTRNWTDEFPIAVGDVHAVRWIDMEDVESPNDDLRYRGFQAGAARFARGEGMWYADGDIFFACTSGGSTRLGQIWKYTPSDCEGQPDEDCNAGKLQLYIEPNNSKLVSNADNLTAALWGDLVVCEDRDGDQVRLVGVTPEGKLYTLADNHAHTEFAGVTFSPDNSTLFVNLQHQGMTLAITGPWPRRA